MKTVKYKGKSFTYKVMGNFPNRHFSLYGKDGLLMHFVPESELDKRPSLFTSIANAYYRTIMEEPGPFMG